MTRYAHSRRRYRALFLSDVHLGSRACKAEQLADFLRHHDAETIYLVGDIVDGWRLSASWYWPPAHDAVVRQLIGAAQRGSRIVYVPGNHDAFLREYCGTHFGGVEVSEQAAHIGADGRRYLVIHGDCLDAMVDRGRRFAFVGYRVQMALRCADRALNLLRRQLGLPERPFSQRVKLRIKNATSYISSFERAVTEVAHRHAADGVICGHIHHPTIREDRGVRYVNCGDWVESCTAAVEDGDGAFRILSWGPVAAAGQSVPLVGQMEAA